MFLHMYIWYYLFLIVSYYIHMKSIFRHESEGALISFFQSVFSCKIYPSSTQMSFSFSRKESNRPSFSMYASFQKNGLLSDESICHAKCLTKALHLLTENFSISIGTMFNTKTKLSEMKEILISYNEATSKVVSFNDALAL